jgi:aminoglycoside/choline kinase family phosphotransferase
VETPNFITDLNALFLEHFKQSPEHTQLLPLAGSDRKYLRMQKGDNAAIGAFNPNRNENNTFFYFTKLFEKHELKVPAILEISGNRETYLLEDLGPETLFDLLEKEGHTERVKSLFKKSIDALVHFHWDAGKAVDYSLCFSYPVFDKSQILSDLLYFKYYFADLLKVNYNKQELLEEMETWSRNLAARRPQTFMYRDFQSRNIMVRDEEVYFIDYQGGMQGLPQYDLASLLWQARARLPEKWKKELVNYYFEALQRLPEIPTIKETEFRKIYLECVLLRILQTLGAYGFRGLIEKKPHFLESIYPALQQLSGYLEEYPQYPIYNQLRKLLDELVKPEVLKRFEPPAYPKANVEKLKVELCSFSYKNGLPLDKSGHGGGFIFDCRGLHNPGRYEEYKKLTGKDEAVIEFLESKSRIAEFLENVFNVVDISIEDYLSRGFDHLSIAFGCTGGQHRSVYSAEAMAKHLKEKFGINAMVKHREQKRK